MVAAAAASTGYRGRVAALTERFLVGGTPAGHEQAGCPGRYLCSFALRVGHPAGEGDFMARIVYCHPSQTKYDYHIFTDLDFWDARKVIQDLATVKRNFGRHLPGDDFPTQITADHLPPAVIRRIEKRLRQAIVSPPRHVIVRSMIFDGHYEFDPRIFYPERWSPALMMHFTYRRLPLNQGALNNPHQEVRLAWIGDKIRVDKVQRTQKYDPVIRSAGEARKHMLGPSCF